MNEPIDYKNTRIASHTLTHGAEVRDVFYNVFPSYKLGTWLTTLWKRRIVYFDDFGKRFFGFGILKHNQKQWYLILEVWSPLLWLHRTLRSCPLPDRKYLPMDINNVPAAKRLSMAQNVFHITRTQWKFLLIKKKKMARYMSH